MVSSIMELLNLILSTRERAATSKYQKTQLVLFIKKDVWLQMAYNFDVVKTNVPEALEVLLDAVCNPAFYNWELQEQIKRLTKDIEVAKTNPQTALIEVSLSSTASVCSAM